MTGPWQEERVLRLAAKRARELGELSPGAYEELALSVQEDPDAFMADDEERAFAVMARAQEALAASRRQDEFLSDGQYEEALARRLKAMGAQSAEALQLDPGCVDAALVQALARPMDSPDRVRALRELDQGFSPNALAVPEGAQSLWDDVFARPMIRLKAALARTAFEAAFFSQARDLSIQILDVTPDDPLGMRYTCAMALARLEDEKGFDALDARFGRRGNAWSNLARSLMLFKLDRLPAARRALNGFLRLNDGAAYALLRPCYVEPYLPDRPQVEPGSYLEALLAVHEADPIVVDAPDFVDWCSDQPGVLEAASTFAQANGYDW